MIFHMALHIIKKPTSQVKKCSKEPMIMEFTSLSYHAAHHPKETGFEILITIQLYMAIT